MAGPLVLKPFIIESNESSDELLIKNTINDERVLITPNGITNDSLAKDNAVRGLLPEGEQVGLDATTTGVQYEGKTRQLVDESLGDDEREVYLEVATGSSAGDETVTVEVYDYSRDSIIVSQDIAGGSPRVRSGEMSDGLVRGSEIGIRFTVTSASGTSGATFDALMARLMVR